MDLFFFASGGDEYAIAKSSASVPGGYEPVPVSEAAWMLAQLPADGRTAAFNDACTVLGFRADAASDPRLADNLKDALDWGEVVVYRQPSANGLPRASQSSASNAIADLKDLMPVEPLVTQEHWLEILVVDKEEAPVAGVRCVVELPDGGTRHARTNDEGVLYLDGLTKPGACKVRFPEMHADVFDQA